MKRQETDSVRTAEHTGNKKKLALAVILIVVLLAVFAGIYRFFAPKSAAGNKDYTLAVVDDAGNTVNYQASTDAEYLRQALEELEKAEDFSIEGEEESYGLYIKTVNGVTADYDTDGAYWSIYVNGEYAANGVDSQPVNDGGAYRLVYEK